MPALASIPSSNRLETYFFETPPIPPSSLAFFISGFSEAIKETDAVKHLVSVRRSEMDYTEKLFDMTETLLEAVESFMMVKLPSGVLHSVALPNYELKVESFYGFNFYR